MGTEKDVIGCRILARIIDEIVLIVASIMIFTWALAIGTAEVAAVMILTIIALWIGYGILFETWRGQTIGKIALDIIVVKTDGLPCDFISAVIRNLLRILDVIGFWLLGFIIMVVSDRRQRIGDHVANTMVVRVKRQE